MAVRWSAFLDRLHRGARARPTSRRARHGGGFQLWCHATTGAQAHALAELSTRCTGEAHTLEALITTGGEPAARALSGLSLPDTVAGLPARNDAPDLPAGFHPGLVIWTGNPEMPPAVMRHADQGARLVLVDLNAPSQQVFRRWKKPGYVRANLGKCTRIFAADQNALEWLEAIGVAGSKARMLGPLRHGIAIAPCDEYLLSDYADLTSARPIWLCVDFTMAERGMILEAHRNALRAAHRLLLVIVPADADSGPEIARWFDDAGLRSGCQSLNHSPEPECQIFVADDPADANLWYRLATISFMGGSFGEGGRENPFRPAALGSAVIHGPRPGSHDEFYRLLSEAGGAASVGDQQALSGFLMRLLSPHHAAEMAHRAWQVTSAGAELIDALTSEVQDAIDPARAKA